VLSNLFATDATITFLNAFLNLNSYQGYD